MTLNVLSSDTESFEEVTLLDAIRFVKKAWGMVTQKTIKNCWCHAGFSSEFDEEDDLPLNQWLAHNNLQHDLAPFLLFDEDVSTHAELTDAEIVEQVASNREESGSEDEENDPEVGDFMAPPVTVVLNNIKTIIAYYESVPDSHSELVQLDKMQSDLQKTALLNKKQSKLTDFFKSDR